MGSRVLILVVLMGMAGSPAIWAQSTPAPAPAPAVKAPAAAKAKGKAAAKAPMAVWSSDVMHSFGILPSQFAGSGLAKLTQPQLDALLAGIKPKGTTISCPAPNTSGKTRVLLTVSGEDATDAIAGEIKAAVSGLSDVQVVDDLAQADATLGVVVQALSMNKKIIGYTASYVLGTPCTEQTGDKKTPVQLKGVLGSTMTAKTSGLAQNLATTMDKELSLMRTAAAK
jgi:hypothetical protein